MNGEIKITIVFLSIILFGVFGVVEKSWATTYYVSQNDISASDSNPGTESFPWKTLKYATLNVIAGDIVIVKEGEYIDEAANAIHPYPSFRPANSGIEGSPITFRSEPRLAAKIKAKEYPGGYMAWGINDRNYIVIDGFHVTGGLRINTGNNIEIKNSELVGGFYPPSDPSLNWGIALEHVNDSIVENNYVHDMLDSGNNSHNCSCFMVFGSSDNNVIQRNTADVNNKIAYSGFGQKGGSMDYNTWRYNFVLNGTVGFLGMGSTDGTAPSTHNDFYQNIIINTDSAFELDHRAEDFKIYNNTAYNCKNLLNAVADDNLRTEIWNNIASSAEKIFRWSGYPGPLPFSTLISYSDYNNFFGAYPIFAYREKSPTISYSNLATWQTNESFDLNSSNIDPNFINSGGTSPEDYKLGLYPTNGRGGVYALVMGAYITGGEIIGYNELNQNDSTPPSTPSGLSVT